MSKRTNSFPNRKNKYPIHPDFKRWQRLHPPLNRALLPLFQGLLRLLLIAERGSYGLSVTKFKIPVDEKKSVKAILYSPKTVDKKAPCLVYYHGGGFVFPAAPYHFKLVRKYALKANCKALIIDYRLAPKHPFPTAPKDCFNAYCWVVQNADKLSIDAERVAVGGDSAGGELATVVCLMAKEQEKTLPCAQLLIYPVTARGLNSDSMKKYFDTPMCNSRDIQWYDRLYVQDSTADRLEYSSPIHAPSLQGLPMAYIETAEFDCLHDEAILYAERLKKSGVETELFNTKGTMHGFDIVLSSPIVKECINKRIAFLRRAFYRIDA